MWKFQIVVVSSRDAFFLFLEIEILYFTNEFLLYSVEGSDTPRSA